MNETIAESHKIETYNGFTEAELSRAFDRVKNSDHWKGPIDGFCRIEERYLIASAIMFYTSTEARFSETLPGVSGSFVPLPADWLRVQAVGYWNGPAN